MTAVSSGTPARIKVWDPLVRVFHWGLASSFAIAWFTAEDWRSLHEYAGYAAGALVALRFVMGLAGSRYARFSQFLRSPRDTLDYLRALMAGREPRYIGHNPLGGLMVMVLIVTMAALATTGYMQTTDMFWGYGWVEETHEFLADLLVLFVAIHLSGVIVESLRHRENLVAAMISGFKKTPGARDVV